MAASGVISITAQIMESAETEGSSESPSSGPSKSFMQRLKANLKGLKSGWKDITKVGGTGLFYLMLSQSKLASGVVKGMLQMVGAIVDLLLDNFGIVRMLGWLIPKMSSAVQKIGDFLQGIGPVFRKIWGVVWDWISSQASSAGDTLLNLFKNIIPESVSSAEVEKLVQERILQLKEGETIITEAEKQAFLDGTGEKGTGLIDEPAFTQEEVDEIADHYRGLIQGEVDEIRVNEEAAYAEAGEAQWYHEGGPERPGGPITAGNVNMALQAGDVVIIDEKLDAGEDTLLTRSEDMLKSWGDSLGQFQWSDITGLFSMPSLNPVDLIGGLFGSGDNAITPEKAMTTILSRSLQGGTYKAPPGGHRPDESQHLGWEEADPVEVANTASVYTNFIENEFNRLTARKKRVGG